MDEKELILTTAKELMLKMLEMVGEKTSVFEFARVEGTGKKEIAISEVGDKFKLLTKDIAEAFYSLKS